jgi:hypothetical protein
MGRYLLKCVFDQLWYYPEKEGALSFQTGIGVHLYQA